MPGCSFSIASHSAPPTQLLWRWTGEHRQTVFPTYPQEDYKACSLPGVLADCELSQNFLISPLIWAVCMKGLLNYITLGVLRTLGILRFSWQLYLSYSKVFMQMVSLWVGCDHRVTGWRMGQWMEFRKPWMLTFVGYTKFIFVGLLGCLLCSSLMEKQGKNYLNGSS